MTIFKEMFFKYSPGTFRGPDLSVLSMCYFIFYFLVHFSSMLYLVNVCDHSNTLIPSFSAVAENWVGTIIIS